jgi:hypothetical protein
MQTGDSLGIRVRAAARRGLALAGLVLAAPMAVSAQPMASPPGIGGGLNLGLGLHAGTTGLGVDVSKLLFSHLGIRSEFNYLGLGMNETFSDVTFNAKLRLQSIPVLMDLYPAARGAFHVTGGVVFNQTHLIGTGVPGSSGSISINHDSYTSSEVGTLSGAFRYPATGGYFGLGFGTPAKKSLMAGTFNIGVILGKPNVSLSATGASSNPALASDLAAQQATTQNTLNKVTVYPVLSTGFMLRL